MVLFGHETKIIVEVIGIPAKSTLTYEHHVQDLSHNKMGLIMLIDGFPKEQYILENENEQTIRLKLKERTWVSSESDELIMKKSIHFILLIIAMIPLIYVSYRDRKNFRK
jgi:hypothetical protein